MSKHKQLWGCQEPRWLKARLESIAAQTACTPTGIEKTPMILYSDSIPSVAASKGLTLLETVPLAVSRKLFALQANFQSQRSI
jgi:hypothetical protein